VCEYIPEFGIHKKHWITIRHVLTHRAGIPNLPRDVMVLENLADWDNIVRILCAAKPTARAGRQLAYHAITGGFILGEVVRRVTGKDIRAVIDEEIRQPLGFRWMSYGARARDIKQVALNYFTGPLPLPPFSTILDGALGVPFQKAVEMSNDRRFLLGVIPSGNIVATADELSRFYQMLLNGGELDGVRIFEPRTIRRATAEESYLEIDFTLGFPFRYSMGFMLGSRWFSPYGSDTELAYGHLGFTNILSWADPERQIAVALMTSGKPLVYAQIYYAFDLVRQISIACGKEPARPRAATVVPHRRPRLRKKRESAGKALGTG
jgi:CubicO group peptidase (beta-lactamase class C family)